MRGAAGLDLLSQCAFARSLYVPGLSISLLARSGNIDNYLDRGIMILVNNIFMLFNHQFLGGFEWITVILPTTTPLLAGHPTPVPADTL
jgi:hypothetical protein